MCHAPSARATWPRWSGLASAKRMTGGGMESHADREAARASHARAGSNAGPDPRLARHLLLDTSRDDVNRPHTLLSDGRWALGRGSQLAGIATRAGPGLCRSHNPQWSPLPDGRLPLRQGLHKLRTAAGSLLVRTSSDSAASARASTTALAGEGRAAGIARASVDGVELHMHPDVGVCAIGYDELIAVLLLRQQREHAVQPAPGLWNGRNAEPSRRCGPDRSDTAQIRPSGKRLAGVGWCPLGL